MDSQSISKMKLIRNKCCQWVSRDWDGILFAQKRGISFDFLFYKEILYDETQAQE
jgi:hypothetical protein